MIVPNQFPTIDLNNRRIAVIDLCPSTDELKCGVPFSSKDHGLIKSVINQSGHTSMACFFGYLSNAHLPHGKIPHGSPEYAVSRANLKRDLDTYKPNIIILLHQTLPDIAGKHEFKIDSYRGSLFICDDPSSPFYGFKCISTYPPRNVFIQYHLLPFVSFDIQRALSESSSPELVLPFRDRKSVV